MNLNAVASLPETLKIMGLGMLGIFIVTLAIVLVIALLNILSNPKKQEKAK
jgi:D-arabinose 1-dehydrogenase-like Zn-dependent alcohol dehydrogenase